MTTVTYYGHELEVEDAQMGMYDPRFTMNQGMVTALGPEFKAVDLDAITDLAGKIPQRELVQTARQ